MRKSALVGVAVLALIAGPVLAQTSDWVRRPTGKDLEQYYPPVAKLAEVGGTATLTCKVTGEGLLERCTVVGEQPGGMGFGEAGLKLAPLFQMKPTARDGKSSVAGANVTIPIRFGFTDANGALLEGPFFVSQPSAGDVAAAYPRAARDTKTSGAAQLRCAVLALGRLDSCQVVAEAPAGQGFGAAALKLAPLYKLNPLTHDGKPVAGGQVTVPITFAQP